MTGHNLSIAADTHCHTGEGPLWHPDEEVVYFVDIPRGDLYRYVPGGGYDIVLDHDAPIGGITIQDDGDLLLFGDEGRIQPWSVGSGLGDPLVEAIEDEENSRFNDVIADPRGRVYAGTMPTAENGGSLYRLDTNGSLSTVETDVAIPNGLGFSPDRRHLYFTETLTNRIYCYDYDQSTGTLSNRRVFVDTNDATGKPDGMTVDSEGYVWSAFWNGGCTVRYAPDGTEARRVSFPARKVSAITFGRGAYETAYVTTALGPGDSKAGTRGDEGPGAGALFELDLGVAGVPEFRSGSIVDGNESR